MKKKNYRIFFFYRLDFYGVFIAYIIVRNFSTIPQLYDKLQFKVFDFLKNKILAFTGERKKKRRFHQRQANFVKNEKKIFFFHQQIICAFFFFFVNFCISIK